MPDQAMSRVPVVQAVEVMPQARMAARAVSQMAPVETVRVPVAVAVTGEAGPAVKLVMVETARVAQTVALAERVAAHLLPVHQGDAAAAVVLAATMAVEVAARPATAVGPARNQVLVLVAATRATRPSMAEGAAVQAAAVAAVLVVAAAAAMVAEVAEAIAHKMAGVAAQAMSAVLIVLEVPP